MKNAIKSGATLQYLAPYDRLSGEAALLGSIFGVAMNTVLSGVLGVFELEGCFKLAKATGALAVGDKAFWDDTNKRLTTDATLGPLVAVCVTAALSGDAKVEVKLNESPARRSSLVAVEASTAPVSKSGAATLTAAEVLAGIVVDNPGNTGIALTFPTAALLVAAIPGAKVGDLIKVQVINGDATATHIVTLTEGSGGSWDANQAAGSRIVPVLNSKTVFLRLTNVTLSSEAYVMYA